MRKVMSHKETLVRAGAECTHLPFVLAGGLRVFTMSERGRELTLYRIEPGESCIISATCILNERSFPAVAAAEGPTEVLLVPARPFLSLVEESREWRKYLFDLYAKRLETVFMLVEEVAFRHVDLRIALHLSRRSAGNGGIVRMTHAEIADELGTSREVVTRILKDLEADGLIATSRGRIEVLKPDELERRGAINGEE
jgi:CRP/FNR family transcriptional regulator, anaerobic regulatory protein